MKKMWAKDVLNCDPYVITNGDYNNLPENQKEWYYPVVVIRREEVPPLREEEQKND